jgi:dTDP-4-amino-4,6-dideoxygalactose transaminase
MYKPGQIQCLSFGRTKPLEIGRGGCVLTDDPILAKKLNSMRYDGRDILKYNLWADQKVFEVGYHYYLRPEESIIGINKLLSHTFVEQVDSFYNYPDCKTLEIK